MKQLTLINSSAPYQTGNAQESLDFAMVAGTFGQAVSLLFMGDGVFQLLGNQQGKIIGRKTLSKTLAALEFYDIDDIYVCANSLSQRYLNTNDLVITAKPLQASEIQQLFANSDQLMRF